MAPETNNTQRPNEGQLALSESLARSDALRKALSLPADVSDADWKMHLNEALAPVEQPDEKNVVNPTPVRMEFLKQQCEKISSEQRETALFFKDIVEYETSGPLPDIYKGLTLKMVANLINAKRSYADVMHEEKNQTKSELPSYLAMAILMGPEDKVSDTLSVRERVPSFLQKMDIPAKRAFIQAERSLTQKLQRAGVRNPNVSAMLSKMSLQSAAMTEKMLMKAVPNSYYDLLLLSYFLHESEDKAAAAVQFGSFIAAQGMTEIALEAAMANSRFAKVRGLLKKPSVVTLVALALVVVAEKTTGAGTKIVEGAESAMGSANWTALGQAIEFAPLPVPIKLIDDLGALGYMTGLRSVDPQRDQRAFLSRQVFQDPSTANRIERMRGGANIDERGFRKDYIFSFIDWDEQVEAVAAETEKYDPTRAEIYRLSKVGGGGGPREWASREAVRMFQNTESLRGMQNELNELVGLSGSAVAFDLVPTVITKQNQKDMYIDLLTKTEQYTRILEKINQLPEDQRANAKALYENCVALARSIATDVSLYTHLGVYDESWTVYRNEEGERLLPKMVEDGIVSTLALQAKYSRLDPQYHEKKYAESLGEKFRAFKDKKNEWPDIFEHPVDFLGRLKQQAMRDKSDAAIDARNREAVDINVMIPSMMDDIARITGNNPELKHALGPVLKLIDEKKDNMSANDIQDALIHSLAEAMPDERLRKEWYPSHEAEEIWKKSEKPGLSSFEMENIVSEFAQKAGPSLSFYESQGLSYRSDYRFRYNPHSDSWDVVVQPSVVNPNNRGFAQLGTVIRPVHMTPPPRIVPFEEWAETHPQSMEKIVPELEKYRQWIDALKQKKEAVVKQEAVNKPRNDAIERAKATPGVFVDIPASTAGERQDPEMRAYLADGTHISMPYEPQGVSQYVAPTDGMQKSPYDYAGKELKFAWKGPEGAITNMTVNGSGFRNQENLDDGTKYLMFAAFCTPIEGKDWESISKVLNAFRFQNYVPNGFTSLFGATNRYYKGELANQLLPLYSASQDKGRFLRELFLEIERQGGITESSVPTIVNHMRQNP